MTHTLNSTKRASTTKKLSKADTALLSRYTRDYAGVVVRYRGQEYGAICVGTYSDDADNVYQRILTLEGDALDPKQCTIRKTTIATMQADLGI